jgi:hypothetical protein
LQSGQGNLSEIFDDNTEQTSQPNKSYKLIALLGVNIVKNVPCAKSYKQKCRSFLTRYTFL